MFLPFRDHVMGDLTEQVGNRRPNQKPLDHIDTRIKLLTFRTLD